MLPIYYPLLLIREVFLKKKCSQNMNLYMFLVGFVFVCFSFVSSSCCRRHDRYFVDKKIGHQIRKKGLAKKQTGTRNLKPHKDGTQWENINHELKHFTHKRNDRTIRASKEKSKLNNVRDKKQVKSKNLRVKKDRPNGHIAATRQTQKPHSSSDKAKLKTKKFSLSFAPSSSLTPQSQMEDGYQRYSPETSGQERYFSNNNNIGNPGSESSEGGQDNVQFTNQQGYQNVNGGQNGLVGFQENNNRQERIEDKQSVGMLQALMEQRALLGQQSNQQEEMQRLPEQQETLSFQGTQEQNQEGQLFRQDEDAQQNAPQEGAEQFQQGVGRETTQQQVNVQEQGGQDSGNQEVNLQEGGEQGTVVQQGANQEASFQQGNEQENGEQQTGQIEAGFHQGNSPETVTQQGNEQENYLQQGNDQDPASQHEIQESATTSYQQDNDQTAMEQQVEPSQERGTDGGSIANLFADANQGTGQEQDTQSLINEGQSITGTDAAQLAAAIANANKGLTTYGEQNSLASVASNSAGALSFTGGEQSSSSKGINDLSSTVNRFTPENGNINQENNNDFSLLEHQEEDSQKGGSYSQQYDQNALSSSPSLEEEFMKFGGSSESSEHQQHVNTGMGNIADDSVKIVNLDESVSHRAAKYCTGCPRNARCIDKVCIINDDEPLAKILGALSGPENVTDDCRGCHQNAKCIKKECICKPGFTGDGVECRADSCLPGCSKHGKCIRGFCVCDHHHYFNGVECAPYKIRHRACPDKCISDCISECPESCCKSHVELPKTTATTTTTTTAKTTAATTSTRKPASTKPTMKPTVVANKKLVSDVAADFYLKPTIHNNVDVFNKHVQQKKPVTSNQLVPLKKGNTLSDNDTLKVIKPQLDAKSNKQVVKTPTRECNPECSGGRCNSSCPDNCCRVNVPSSSQIDFLKAFAEKFCPSACQDKCQSTCPPICCEKRSFASILRSSPGASNVDVSKAEDIFRNAMGWFGMMNFLHMMYNMYGNTYKPQNTMSIASPKSMMSNVFLKMQDQGDQNAKIKAKVPKNPFAFLPCQPVCTKTCISTCPPRCCPKKPYFLEGKPKNIDQTYTSKVSQTSSSQSLHSNSCPESCATLCSPTCPLACCAQPQAQRVSVSSVASSNSKYTPSSCRPGCSSKCYPLCMDSCCKAVQRTIQVFPTTKSFVPVTKPPTKLPYGCPLQCPKSCFPTCSRVCCFAAQQYKPGLLNRHGQYVVSIPCPLECRPYNCLSYCHHECCLRTNNSYHHLKSHSSNSKPINKATSSSESRFGRFGIRFNTKSDKSSQLPKHPNKDLYTKKKYAAKSSTKS